MASAAPEAQETLYSDLNAYNPIPNASGTTVAFIRTGWGRPGGSGGFGRSNLMSFLEFAGRDGKPLAHPSVDAFLDRWVDDAPLFAIAIGILAPLRKPGGGRLMQSQAM
jgi:hypothetical protein